MAAGRGKAEDPGALAHGGSGGEVAEDSTQVVEYAAAIDLAKGSGMVCTRVPGTRRDRRRQKVWRAGVTFKEVTALMDRLRAEGIRRLVLESTSDYWRIWYHLAEAAGLEVWLVNARDVKHLPGRSKSDKADCVWLANLNERGMLRRSFVPPQPVRDLRALTRTRGRLAQDQGRHQARVEKILEDALHKISVVISDLFGVSGRRFLDALVARERSPAALAALGDKRLKATRAELEEALTGRFHDIHAFEIALHLRLIDAVSAEIAAPDEQIERQLRAVPGTAPACVMCGLAGGGHAAGCADEDIEPLDLAGRLGEITGIGPINGRAVIAEFGTDTSSSPLRARRRVGAADTANPAVRGNHAAGPHRQGQPVPARRARPGRDDRGQDRYPAGGDVPPDRPQARQAESHRRGLPRHLRDRLDPHLRPLSPVPGTRPGLLPAPQPRPPDTCQDPRDRAPQPRQESHPR